MHKSVSSLLLLSVMTLFASVQPATQVLQSEPAGIDAQGNIYVSSDAGRHIIVGNTSRCWEAAGDAQNRQIMACLVKENPQAGNPMFSLKLELYSRGGLKRTIQPGQPIRDWHFWNSGEQVAIFFGEPGNKGTYGLYDSATGLLVQQLAEPMDESLLPQWAKSRLQIENESVPVGPQFSRERTMWITKVLYQIGKLQPGMRRKDLLKTFTEEGGISTRLAKTYVYPECRLIKVDVRFKAVNDAGNGKEDPEDLIESISRPYLAWSVMD